MIWISTVILSLLPAQEEAVSFNRDVRPILAENCFSCHGPDARHLKGKLRLDVEGTKTVIASNPSKSKLIRRITHSDPDERMPPPETRKSLDETEIETLRRWIRQGAAWQGHWSFIPPVRPPFPAVKNRNWSRNGVDRFILARLEKEGLSPSAEAGRAVLIRRITLDLTGLPPSRGEVDAFLSDTRPDAFERVVDRLLQSPHYGERMAQDWMDAARYADTHGLHVDSIRHMWPWRDWVIGAFNANLPYDQFTVEQLAGDLLPGATRDQVVATGFNRNHLISYQGGALEKKLEVMYRVDRVNTTATVWLGLTMGCAQCHDHKFDPIPQADYYRMYAFFNSIAEKPKDGRNGNAQPKVSLESAAQRGHLATLRAEIRKLEGRKEKDKAIEAKIKKLKDRERGIVKKIPDTMVMKELPKPRDTFMLNRGEYNQPGEKVTPGTPGFLPPLPEGLPRNRLGLARWLVDPNHPLTARVAVNRLWQQIFGIGIVETSEDFGTQGEWPVHPELLDWLAVEFVERGWDVKSIMRLLVTSETYRQCSAASPDLVGRDPRNRLLARGPRFRLAAEQIRDQALAAGGLLCVEVGGPSVRPYQPDGVWKVVAAQKGNYTAQKYVQDHGKNLYRRGLYTFWKRLAPPPTMLALDAPKRDTCVMRRQRTNTPLQALALMNDPTFVEAARALAGRVIRRTMDDEERVALAFSMVLARRPTAKESEVLLDLLEWEREAFAADAAGAAKLVGVGESAADPSIPRGEWAAWTAVTSVILNLDEAVTKG